jgi:hypothetical protein
MAAAAIRLVRLVEQLQAAQFALAEPRFALQPVVELAGVGMEARLFELITRDGEHRLRDQQLRTSEDAGTEKADETLGIGRVAQLVRHPFGAATVHLARVEQRKDRLILQRIGAAVPEQAALRHDIRRRRGGLGHGLLRACGFKPARSHLRQVHDVIVVAVVGTNAEIRLALEIGQRRNSARALPRHGGAAEHDRPIVRRTVSVVRAVTGRA